MKLNKCKLTIIIHAGGSHGFRFSTMFVMFICFSARSQKLTQLGSPNTWHRNVPQRVLEGQKSQKIAGMD